MKRRLFFSLLGGFALFFISTLLKAQQLPTIPVGLDAYKQWDQWPTQRLGVRAYMRSTYDRTGGNESADASHFLFANGENENVTLDVKGKGVLYFFRANHWHGSPWHFMVDGVDHLVSETGTSEPTVAKRKFKVSNFIPETTYPRPLNWTWEVTKGADLIWTPMPFEQIYAHCVFPNTLRNGVLYLSSLCQRIATLTPYPVVFTSSYARKRGIEFVGTGRNGHCPARHC